MTPGTVPYIEHYVMVEDLKLVPYILGLASALVLIYALYEGYKRWTHGGQKIEWAPITARVSNLVKYALLQWKVLRHRFPGTMHLLIYAGMLWLFIATLLRALDLRIAEWTGSPLLAGSVFEFYKLLSNIAGVAVVLGSIIAIIRRAAGLTPNLPKDKSYYAVHIGFILIAVTGFLLDGMAAAASPARASTESPVWDPVGYAVYSWASGLSFEELRAIYRPLWVIHLFIAQLMLALIPFTNLWHIASASLNVALARREPLAMALKPVLDIDARVEEEKPIGVVKLSDTTWKQRLDYDACTSCMRCTNSCPAFATDKPLSPRDLIITLRDAMYAGKWDEEVVGKSEFKIEPDTVWSCVTCGACLHECPVLIHHVDTIIDLRRGLISTGSEEVPEDAQNALYNMMQQGNPFGFNPADRDEWLQSLAEKYGEDIIAREGVEYDYLYWLGCVTSYDPRIRPVAGAVIELLRKAGYTVAVIPDETCCGEPARRMGEETLFVEMMKQNLEVLSQYKFKRLLVNCPHGYHVFKNEYPRYLKYLESNEETKQLAEVVRKLVVEHHSTVLGRLVKEGKIPAPKLREQLTATYHDPCYLGRWNGIYEEPREILRSIGGLRLREMPRNRDKSFCCGGGGGHMFYEIKKGERIATVRAREAAGTGAKVVAVACPYCNTMFRAEAQQFDFEVRDIAELLREGLAREEQGSKESE